MKLCWEVKMAIFSQCRLLQYHCNLIVVGESGWAKKPHPQVRDDGSVFIYVPRKWLDEFLNENPKLKERQVLFQMRDKR